MGEMDYRLQTWAIKQAADRAEQQRLAVLNQPPTKNPEELTRPTKCKVRGVDATYSWLNNGAPVTNGQIIELPADVAIAYAKQGRVDLL